jgi:hypothetical protein
VREGRRWAIDTVACCAVRDRAASPGLPSVATPAGATTTGKNPEFIDSLQKVGAETAGGTPEQFAKTYRDEAEDWKALIQQAGIKPERSFCLSPPSAARCGTSASRG